MSKLEKAHKTEADLHVKHREAREVLADVDTRRSRLAFSAHTGDAAAKKKLDALNVERGARAADVDSIETAIEQAKRNVAEAMHEADAEAGRTMARKCKELALAASPRGARIAQAAKTLRDELMALAADIEAMRRLGAPLVQQRLVDLAMTRGITPILREAGLELEIVPPMQRSDIAEVAGNYISSAQAWADRVLDGETAKAEAA